MRRARARPPWAPAAVIRRPPRFAPCVLLLALSAALLLPRGSRMNGQVQRLPNFTRLETPGDRYHLYAADTEAQVRP